MSWGNAKRLLPTVVLIAVLLGGLALRLDFARHAVTLVGDQNTPPLMALHISQARDFPLYFYGQHYMGGIDPYVCAGLFALLGPSDFAYHLGMALLSLLWPFALYLLFRRLVGQWAGLLAAAVVAFPVPWLIRTSVMRTGYVCTFAYGTLILYLGVRLNEQDTSSRAERGCLLGMGALAGLCIWTNPMSAPYLIVGFGLLAAHVVRSRFRRPLMAKLAAAFLLFLVTLSPVIITACRYGLRAMFGFRPSKLSYVPKVTGLVFTRYVPHLFQINAGLPGPLQWVLAAPYLLLPALLAAGLIVGLAKRKPHLVRAALVPVVLALIYLPFFLTHPLAAAYGPRYFLVFYLLIAGSFAFPLVLRRPWISWTAATLVAIVAANNIVACLAAGRGEAGRTIAERRAARSTLVEGAEAAGLRHVMHDTSDAHAFTWTARERVVFASPWGERYYPYVAAAIADDGAGFCRPQPIATIFEETLATVGVTRFETFSAGQWCIFHHLELPTGQLRLVEPVGATLVNANGNHTSAHPLIDQDDDTLVGAPYDADATLVIDFGEPIRPAGVRFLAPKEWDYPAGYTISGSLDGSMWKDIQRVARREAATCIYGNRLFHRGRFTAMECRFSSEPVRYLKLDDLSRPAVHIETWRIREAYFYRAADQGPRPDEREAAEITRTLQASGVEFALCDPWLSAKIEAAPRPRPAVLPYYSSRHRASQVSRVVPVRRGVAIVVENAHAAQARKLLLDATLGDVKTKTHSSANYTATIITDAPAGYESFPGLRWNGFTLARTARIATAAWYYDQGLRLEGAGRPDDAQAYFKHSFKTYEGIRGNLEKLAPHDEDAAQVLEKLTPAVRARCRFPYGVSLVGYTLAPGPLVPGQTATLRLVWELEGKIPYDYLPVFLHFVRGEAIRFQADHNVTFPLAPRATVPRCLVLDEHTFTVPLDCPPGQVTVRLGAVAWWDPGERLKPHTKLPHRGRAVEIGTATVGNP